MTELPDCPSCNGENMTHKCFSHVPASQAFKKNGWYCDDCQSGPYQLGFVTEEFISGFAKRLLAEKSKPVYKCKFCRDDGVMIMDGTVCIGCDA